MIYLVRLMITIEVTQKVLAPAEQVNQVLLDHLQLGRFFNAKFKLIKIQNKGELIGGKGAIRQISIGKIVFEEEIISATNEHICYRIVGNWPVSDHQGDIQLTSFDVDNQTTQLDYVIKFNGPKWLPAFLLKFFVASDISKAMKKLAEHFADRHISVENIA
ncbi:hypothetical protein CPS_3619 [Colwellia psychrerythraea 34H]|uniref:Polyketide cyclase/dehydrase n=2 Tax=Colwellia psychrerythraea TaxID=28229 RepID=Q47Y33_COLP3|nr:hypothetical protein CPS_3619 [Colwellia psychrerythraea 34H]